MRTMTCKCGGRYMTTRTKESGWDVLRTRKCNKCGQRIKTVETYSDRDFKAMMKRQEENK